MAGRKPKSKAKSVELTEQEPYTKNQSAKFSENLMKFDNTVLFKTNKIYPILGESEHTYSLMGEDDKIWYLPKKHDGMTVK
jgi:hypothetical protein